MKNARDWLVEVIVLSVVRLVELSAKALRIWNEDLETKAYLLRLKVKRRRAARAAVRERLRLEKLQRDRNLWS